MHVAVYVPAVAGVIQLAVPSSQLHVPLLGAMHGRLWAPVSDAGVTVPPLTETSIRSIVVVVPPPPIPEVVSPWAWQITDTVEPGGTSPAGAWIVVVQTVTLAAATDGNAAASATHAYTCRGILMAPSRVQTPSLGVPGM